MFKGKAFSPGFEHIWGLDSEQALVPTSVYRSLSSVLLSISVSWAPVLVPIPVYLSVSSSLCSISIALVPVQFIREFQFQFILKQVPSFIELQFNL